MRKSLSLALASLLWIHPLPAQALSCLQPSGTHPFSLPVEPPPAPEPLPAPPPISSPKRAAPPAQPMLLWKATSEATGLPWTYLAAINQIEKGFTYWQKYKKERPWLAIHVPPTLWNGWMNPEKGVTNALATRLFGGIGQDADGDGEADPDNAMDVLYSLAHFLTQQGTRPEQLHSQLWNYYHDGGIVSQVIHIAQIYQATNTDQLFVYRYPLPARKSVSIQNNWQTPRSWGKKGKKIRRFHEGIDLFAPHGTTLVAPCYGYIEQIGWNEFGGWRLGIRDAQNRYHYLAHLAGFRRGLTQGDIVKPGDKLGTVGSSGYGRPGTQGKFPAHLHYGLYLSNEKGSYAVNPLLFLKKTQQNGP